MSPAAHWLIEPVHLPPPLPNQNQDAESLAFLVSFAVLVPLAALFVPRTLDRVAARHGRGLATDLALVLGITMCLLLTATKISEHLLSAPAMGMLFIASALWSAIAATALSALLRTQRAPRLLTRLGPGLWPLLAASLGVVLVCITHLRSISLAPLLVGVTIAGVAGYLAAYRPPSFRVPTKALRWGADVAAVALIALAVPNLVVFRPEDPAAGLQTAVIQFHQNFYLGPANSLLGGGTMLVDVFSQYGVGSILFLAGVFNVVPIGNGTLALTEGVLSAGMFCLAYVALRLAGVGLALAWTALAVAVFVLVFNLENPVGALLQHGAFRFGLPMVMLAAVAGQDRLSRERDVLGWIQIAVVAVASLWSFEALLYSVGTLAGITAFRVATAPAGRLRIAFRVAIQVIAATIVVQLGFALATLAASGQLPQWDKYLTTLREFLTGKVGEVTYDFSPWSPGLAVGAIYAASLLALVLVTRREPELVAENRPSLRLLSAATGYGLALFSYLVNRSADNIVPYVSLPTVMVVVLWLSILLRDGQLSRLGRGLALGSAAAAAALLVAVAWSQAGLRFSQSALAYAAPGGKSLGSAIDRLVDDPPLVHGTDDATHLLETYMPDEHTSIVLTSADLSVQALVRTHRINQIPLADPWEDSFVPDLHEPAVEAAVAALRPGRRMLIDSAAREFLKEGALPAGPSLVPTGLAPLQALALRRIAERFRLDPVARAPSGVEVVALRAR